MSVQKLFIILGIIFIIIGLLWPFIGKLPGDIVIKKGNVKFYFPLVTSIMISMIMTLIFYLLNKFR